MQTDRRTDGRTDGQTFVIVELLSQLKMFLKPIFEFQTLGGVFYSKFKFSIHTPVPVPSHWEEKVYKGLMSDLSLK